MTALAILNDVHDAEWIRRYRDQYRDFALVATHAAVHDYLEACSLPCEYLSSYIKSDELLNLYKQSNSAKQLLKDMDAEFGHALNKAARLDVQLDFFYDLYRYLGQYEYLNYLKLDLALNRLIAFHHAEQVTLFQHNFAISAPSSFATNINIFELLLRTRGVQVKEFSAPISKRLLLKESISKKLARIKKGGVFLSKHGVFLTLQSYLSTSRPKVSIADIIAFESSSPSGIILSLDGMNSNKVILSTMGIENASPVFLGKRGEFNLSFDGVSFLEVPEIVRNSSWLSKITLEQEAKFNPAATLRTVLLDDFIHNFNKYLGPVCQLSRLRHKKPLLGALWVSPPTPPSPKPLIVDYLKKQGVPVIGSQHGGNYGIEHNYPRHYDSDFRWCTHYLSYGFTEADLNETDPDQTVECRIMPVGSLNSMPSTRVRRKPVDLLFPVSNASYFHRDTVRPLQHELARYQRGLLRFLDQLPNRRVIIKPFHLYDQATSAFIELLRGLKNVEVVDYLDLTACFEHFDVGAVLIEYISSPLFESVVQDVEVLAIDNPLLPLNQTAGMLLKKRVHLFTDLPSLEQGINEYLAGRLVRLRDPGFVERYLLPDGTERCKDVVQGVFGQSSL